MHSKAWWLLLPWVLTGCTATRLVRVESATSPDPGQPRVVVLEPFFESAPWNRQLQSSPGYVVGTSGGVNVSVQVEVMEKHLYARVGSLAIAYQQVMDEVRRLRPSWKVIAPSALIAEDVEVTMVRVVVDDLEVAGTNRTQQHLACVFGALLPPLWILAAQPVEETHRVYGRLERYQATSQALAPRRLKYSTQPDLAVDTRLWTPLARPFGLDIHYEEGVFVSQSHRERVLLAGFAHRLAQAVVALVEEQG